MMSYLLQWGCSGEDVPCPLPPAPPPYLEQTLQVLWTPDALPSSPQAARPFLVC